MKIAVFCPNLIGDTVMATPTFRALRGQFPDARFTAIIRPQVAPVLDGSHWFDETILFHHRSDRREQRTHAVANLLRQMRNDVAILLPNSFRAAWAAWMAGISRRISDPCHHTVRPHPHCLDANLASPRPAPASPGALRALSEARLSRRTSPLHARADPRSCPASYA